MSDTWNRSVGMVDSRRGDYLRQGVNVWILKTWNGKEFVPWTSGANPSNINKLIQLHELVKPKVPYVVDKVS